MMKKSETVAHPLLRGPMPGDNEARHVIGSACEGRKTP